MKHESRNLGCYTASQSETGVTLRKPFRNPASRLSWLWALLPLLLAAMLTIPLLDVDAFNADEPASLVAAGIHKPNSVSLSDTWNYISRIGPTDAHGWPLLLYFWGRSVGWSEIAVRSLPAFFGLLAIASIFRFGRETLNSWAGHFAALLLSSCVFFLAYMIHARAFTLITLCTVVCIWSYWRITSHTRAAGKRALAGLLLGSAGLLYAHYYSALFLLVLALFHLFFVPRNRRWWQPFLLFWPGHSAGHAPAAWLAARAGQSACHGSCPRSCFSGD